MTLTYEWKVDLALILSVVTIISTSIWSLIQHVGRKRRERAEAYESVYEDCCWILGLPYERKKGEAKQLLYENDDKELEGHVRAYLESLWLDHAWGNHRFVPKRLYLPLDRLYYKKHVMEEAGRFQTEYWRARSNLSALDLSPVNWMQEQEVRQRMTRVLGEVGRRLSRFSHKVRDHWHDATFADPQEVREQYEKTLRACPNFFEHNRRNFKDPYYDLLVCVRREYRGMTTSRTMRIRWFFKGKWRQVRSLTRPIRWFLLIWWPRARHPIEHFRMWRRARQMD